MIPKATKFFNMVADLAQSIANLNVHLTPADAKLISDTEIWHFGADDVNPDSPYGRAERAGLTRTIGPFDDLKKLKKMENIFEKNGISFLTGENADPENILKSTGNFSIIVGAENRDKRSQIMCAKLDRLSRCASDMNQKRYQKSLIS
jgi:hypothetical protein